MESSILALWSLAFTLGMLHAFDADHVLAVSAMGRARPDRQMTLLFCRNWALGHGLTLTVVSMSVLLMGLAVPTQLSTHAETGVALVIMMLAVVLLLDLTMPAHVPGNIPRRGSRHGAVAVGMLHGLAGSAPFLAIIPLAQLHSLWSAFIYLLSFSTGVVFSMMLFGTVLSTVYRYIASRGMVYLKVLRAVIAISALVTGCIMLVRY